MGLITWIKDNINRHKINKAVSASYDGEIDKARDILKPMFQTCAEALPALAQIYYNLAQRSRTEKEAINWIQELKRLINDCTKQSYEAYNEVRSKALTFAGTKARESYKNEQYEDACSFLGLLIDDNSQKFGFYEEQFTQYHVQRLLQNIKNQKDYKTVIAELKKLVTAHPKTATNRKNQILTESKGIAGKKQYQKAIDVLIELYPSDCSILIQCSVWAEKLIQQKLKGKTPANLSIEKITKNAELQESIAKHLHREAKNITQYKDYSTAVKYCELAMPYLHNSKPFVTDYCNYRYCEVTKPETMSKHAESVLDGINSVIADAKKYGLDQSYVDKLNHRTLELATQSLSQKPELSYVLSASRVNSDSSFRSVLFSSAQLLFEKKSRIVNTGLLQTEIEKIIDSQQKLELYSLFLPYVPEYREAFLKQAIIDIRSRSNDNATDAVRFFDKWWNVCPSEKYFKDLLDGSDFSRTLCNYVIGNHQKYFIEKDAKVAFIGWAKELPDDESLQILENLLDSNCKIEDEYIDRAVEAIQNHTMIEEQLDLINRALLHCASPKFVELKLSCANKFLEQNRLQDAISVAASLAGSHKLAQVVVAKAKLGIESSLKEDNEKMSLLDEVIALQSEHADPFDQDSFTPICNEAVRRYLDLAVKYHNTGKTNDAYAICEKLHAFDSAIIQLADLKLIEAESLDESELLPFLKSAIDSVCKYKNSAISKSDSYISLWQKYVDEIIKASDYASANTLDSLRVEINNGLLATEAEALEEKVVKKLVAIYKAEGQRREISADYDNATGCYYQAYSILKQGVERERLACRIAICQVKNGSFVDYANALELLNLNFKSIKKEQNDLAYRLALSLIKNGQTKEALDIINNYLPDESELKEAAENGFMINQEQSLSQFNQKIADLKAGTLDANSAIKMVGEVDPVIDSCSLITSMNRNQRERLKDVIKAYAMKKLLDEGEYAKAFTAMKKVYGIWPDDDTAARNLAVACMGIAEANAITKNNYKDIISLFLSLVYQQHLFVKSLDFTSWDDPFTFTLDNALGGYDCERYGDLPDNVTYDEADEGAKIIGIGDVQRSLIQRFEAAISENDTYLQFMNSERSALDSFINLEMDDKCDYVCPYLFSVAMKSTPGIFNSINDALENEIKQHYDFNWERCLEVGLLYGLTNGEFSRFDTAKQYYQKCIDSVNTFHNYKSAFSNTAIRSIRQYPNLFNSMSSAIMAKMASDIKDKVTFTRMWDCYSAVCERMEEQSLTFIFSKYVMSHVVGQVNDDKMTPAQAAPIILKLHLMDKSNRQVRENLEQLVGMLANNYLSKGQVDNLNELVEVLNATRDFDQKVISEVPKDYMIYLVVRENASARVKRFANSLSTKSVLLRNHFGNIDALIQSAEFDKKLNKIIDDANNNRIDNKTALDQVYNLYRTNPNHKHVCETLASIASACIIEYIIEGKYGSVTVKSTLDKLALNLSPVFKSNRTELSKAHTAILAGLPTAAMVIFTLPDYQLTDEAKRLKEGFRYFDKLTK